MILLTTLLVLDHGGRVGLTLPQAVELARGSGTSVRLADSRAAEAHAKEDEALSRLLPVVSASASQMARSYNFLTGGIEFPGFPPRVPFYSIQDVRLGVKGPLFSPAAWNARAAAVSGAKARDTERDALRDDEALRAGLAWIALAKAQSLERDREEALRLARDLERMALDQKASGAASGLDVLRSESQVVASQRALASARLSREQASIALSRELGFPVQDTVAASTALPMDPTTADLAPGASSTSRVAAAEQGRETAKLEVAAYRAQFLPTVGFGADYGLSGRHLEEDGEWTGQVGIFAEWDLWDGGGDHARLAQARERQHQADLASVETRRQSELDLQDARRTLEGSREQLALATRQAALADSQISMASLRFRQGASGNLEVVQAQSERNTAHAAWIEAAGSHQAARVRLLWASGRWDGI